MKQRFAIALTATLAAIAIAVVVLRRDNGNGIALSSQEQTATYAQTPRQRCIAALPTLPAQGAKILLSNRSVVLEGSTNFPARFAAGQTASRRATVPYVVVPASGQAKEVRGELDKLGARVIGYMPEKSFLIEASKEAISRIAASGEFIGAIEFEPCDKIHKRLLEKLHNDSPISISVAAISEDSLDDAKEIATSLGAEISREPSHKGFFNAVMPGNAIAELARHGDVRWIEEHNRLVALNDLARGPDCVDDDYALEEYGLDGSGQVIATADTGLDTGNINDIHQDFAGRILGIANIGGYTTGDYAGHGTHTAGSLAGNGSASGGRFKGAAPAANLLVLACGNKADSGIYLNNVDTLGDLFTFGIDTYGYGIHSDSWGAQSNGAYDQYCVALDDVAWEHPELLIVMAAGNDGSSSGTINAPAAAKNCLAVGNGGSTRGGVSPARVATSSSRGPCEDGRIKPELLAPGSAIVSTRSSLCKYQGFIEGNTTNNYYRTDSGTSMATPHVAGAAALVRQWLLRRNPTTPPTAALLKAILAGGAKDASHEPGGESTSPAPGNDQGWGRVNLRSSLFPEGEAVKLFDRLPIGPISNLVFRVTVTNESPLAVSLAWIDAPGVSGSGKALVNDLDLTVSREDGNGEIIRGNGGENPDALNTIESVRIEQAVPGEYKIKVDCSKTIYDWHEGGAAAVYIKGAFDPDAVQCTSEEVMHFVLTVNTDFNGGAIPGLTGIVNMTPTQGVYSVTEGETVTLHADEYAYLNRSGLDLSRHDFIGWTGSGDIPATGTTTTISFQMTRNSSITWHWTENAADYLLRILAWTPIDFYDIGHIPAQTSRWVRSGGNISLSLPGDSPWGRENKIYSGSYLDPMGNVRVKNYNFTMSGARKACLAQEESSPILNSGGSLAMEFNLTMQDPTDIFVDYWETKSVTNSVLPKWWYERYLNPSVASGKATGLPDDDDDHDGMANVKEYLADTDPVDPESLLRIDAITDGSITWRGGIKRQQLLMTSNSLDPSASWLPIYTNEPPTQLTNTFALPAEGGMRFYKVVVP